MAGKPRPQITQAKKKKQDKNILRGWTARNHRTTTAEIEKKKSPQYGVPTVPLHRGVWEIGEKWSNRRY